VFLLWFGSLYWSLPALLAPKDRVGVVGGAMNFAGSSSGIAVPMIIGYILHATGGAYLVVLYLFAACAGIYAAATLLIDFAPAEAR
jgi:MFS transporter, ACS family, D-galactonate transporter